MVIGRPTDRTNPRPSMACLQAADVLGTRSAEPIWASGLIRPHTQAGHMTASNRSPSFRRSLQAGGRPHMDGRHRAGHDGFFYVGMP